MRSNPGMSFLGPAVLVSGLALTACGESPRVAPAPHVLAFDDLGDAYELADVPEDVRRLSGERVEMAGYLCNLGGTEALLVASMDRSGCAVCMPGVSRSVRVIFPLSSPSLITERVRVTGAFRVSATMQEGYCVDLFQLHADAWEIIK